MSISKPEPFYIAHNLHPAYHLRYGWTAWPKKGSVLPPNLSENFWSDVAAAWEKDGLRLLERQWSSDGVQITFSAKPSISPTFLASRAKGRLQHALRNADAPAQFAGNFSVRALGNNTRETVEQYVSEQSNRADLADPRFADLLSEFSYQDESLRLIEPLATGSGRYWYNLHIVLVVAERTRMGKRETLSAVRDMALRIGKSKGIGIAEWSIMPDHMHALVRPPPDMSAEDVALAFQNNLAWAAGCRLWTDTYYTGTCGEYTMQAVR